MIRGVLGQISDAWMRRRTDDGILMSYVTAGIKFGEAMENLYTEGEPKGFIHLFDRWARLEEEHARRGFRTCSSNYFALLKNSPERLISDLGWIRPFDEKPRLYAEEFRRAYPNWQKEEEPTIC